MIREIRLLLATDQSCMQLGVLAVVALIAVNLTVTGWCYPKIGGIFFLILLSETVYSCMTKRNGGLLSQGCRFETSISLFFG